ncbi:hypothetical protein K7I13_11565 [Brucepastera parasyntrophica]|uniref:hypothetical protein n=1 Tax=Brucepastera parasyntrophica TaxID=2880008 RepID=UPI00210BCFD4|nr:hypothetical protein [Brucepastera parasyntrophica]ULQ59134.1 hypothetical protein K7I13_11565 [Brucepastera parasyntrophica]
MDMYRRNGLRRYIFLPGCFLIFFCVLSTAAYAGGKTDSRNFIADVEAEAGGTLSEDEKNIARFVLNFYSSTYGYGSEEKDAVNRMTADEYANTVSQAAKVAKNPVAKGLLSAGKTGEKVLKALIVTVEDAAKSTGEWINRQSDEYDRRRE